MKSRARILSSITYLPTWWAVSLLLAGAHAAETSFYDEIKPVLTVHCFKCHSGENPKAGLRLDSREGALAGGKSGRAAVLPGDAARSELLRRITSTDPDEQMPPKGTRLTENEVARLGRWIAEGAIWPEQDRYWAFQPPREQIPPAVGGRSRNTIDRFILAQLESAGVQPLPEADARTLLRRAFADLIGLPPSPAETDRFLSDKSADAFERLVDRLLEDPRYGERWARHWLDLARYGESDGYEDDKIRPHAWRYRDYVIRSFNVDKPYDRFVQEQIAGDELWPEDPDAWVATGFVRLGAWDGMSKDPAKQWQDFLNDTTDAVGSVFLGVTLGCARCHDHKYDQITQRDYYQMQSFFAGVKRDAHELPGTAVEPATVRERFREYAAELKRARNERDELRRSAREALAGERTAGSEQEKTKISDSDIAAKVEAAHPGRLEKLNGKIKEMERLVRLHEPKADAVFAGGQAPPPTFLLLGGEVSGRGVEVAPAVIEAMRSGGSPAPEAGAGAGRRAALARWITSPQNPLAARVMVNRLWQHHFGVGIVGTSSDFGRNGQRPSHPELLDWLAREFVRQGYSIKAMHRLIMTSAAYRRSSSMDAAAFARDPGNKLLWRMNRRRLESEAIRDSILAVSGSLSPVMGGPGVYARLPKGVNIEFPNNDKELSWGNSTPEEDHRRSIYLFQRRTLTFPLMDVFDVAPMNQTCPVRPQTTVAPQALALFNGEFARAAAVDFARRLVREVGSSKPEQIRRAFEIAFARPPSGVELDRAQQFLGEQAGARKGEAGCDLMVLADFCHVLLNANEFIYLD